MCWFLVERWPVWLRLCCQPSFQGWPPIWRRGHLSVLFLVVKLSNSSGAVMTGASSVSEEWGGGNKVIPV